MKNDKLVTRVLVAALCGCAVKIAKTLIKHGEKDEKQSDEKFINGDAKKNKEES
jgi:hypothetical protein